MPGEGQRTLAASSLTTAAGLHGSCFFFSSTSSLFLLSSVTPAPLHNCFSIFKELRLKVNNVRNYLKYTRRARRVLSSCVGSTAFHCATAMWESRRHILREKKETRVLASFTLSKQMYSRLLLLQLKDCNLTLGFSPFLRFLFEVIPCSLAFHLKWRKTKSCFLPVHIPPGLLSSLLASTRGRFKGPHHAVTVSRSQVFIQGQALHVQLSREKRYGCAGNSGFGRLFCNLRLNLPHILEGDEDDVAARPCRWT